MNFYKDKEGKWVGTQAEAGNKDVIEIPCTSKPQMLEWLNENAGVREVTSIPNTSNSHANPNCPKCKLTYSAAERIAAGMEVDAIATRILNERSWVRTRLMGAVIEACMELKDDKELSR